MSPNGNLLRAQAADLAYITLGILIYSIGFCAFILPHNVVIGDLEARIQVRTETIIYGWLTIFVYSLFADKYLSKGRQTVQFFILSNEWERIAHRITHETGRSVYGNGFDTNPLPRGKRK